MSSATFKYPPLKEPSPEVVRRVQALADKHKGEVAAIEPASGEFFIAETVIEAAKKGRERFPQANFYFVRIGYPAVDFQSGGLLNK